MPQKKFLSALDYEHFPRHIRVAQAATLAQVTARTIRRWRALGYVRSYRPAGGRVLIDKNSLLAFVEGGLS